MSSAYKLSVYCISLWISISIHNPKIITIMWIQKNCQFYLFAFTFHDTGIWQGFSHFRTAYAGRQWSSGFHTATAMAYADFCYWRSIRYDTFCPLSIDWTHHSPGFFRISTLPFRPIITQDSLTVLFIAQVFATVAPAVFATLYQAGQRPFRYYQHCACSILPLKHFLCRYTLFYQKCLWLDERTPHLFITLQIRRHGTNRTFIHSEMQY